MNVLHTGSIKDDEKDKYDFLFPDFFSVKPETNIKKYVPFQKFNNDITLSSGRKSSKKQIIIKAIKNFIKKPFPSYWGLSILDTKLWLKLIQGILDDPEILRNAQFLMQSRIFINEIKHGFGKDLGVIFTNHVASTLHRNFTLLKDKNMKLDKNSKRIFFSLQILDKMISELYKNKPSRPIVLISALGQKLNNKIDSDYIKKNKVDFKLTDIKKFVNFFLNKKFSYEILGEMIPQYTFKLKDNSRAKEFLNIFKDVGSDPNAARFGYYVPLGKHKKGTDGFFVI